VKSQTREHMLPHIAHMIVGGGGTRYTSNSRNLESSLHPMGQPNKACSLTTMVNRAVVLAALVSTVLAYSDTVPVVAWSSHRFGVI
jgi:hypothetical protein